MFLKRIELSGFKSFADKTALDFVQGITAVVGPNGSGKSNISDSIRWVLGEQRAKSLRGGKMEDIIFAGSEKRRPVNFGEVSLTLDNTDEKLSLDFSEVTVTRRIHRSGDSEYFINKQACRLKDIIELFMDTGIGREAYSIIGQGKIEEILSNRSEERRGIFEEASGIVKFKSRKKESEKKLAETEQNLLRIYDLIAELEDQIEPLQKQSEKAILYKELKEQLKTHDISLYVYKIEDSHQNWKAASDTLNELQNKQIELSTIVNQHDATIEKDRMLAKQLEEELDQLQSVLLNLSEEVEKSEGFGEVLKERHKNLLQQKSQQQILISEKNQRFDNIKNEQHSYENRLDSILKQLEEAEFNLQDKHKHLIGITSELNIDSEEQLQEKLLKTINEIAQGQNEITNIQQQLKGNDEKIEELEQLHKLLTEQNDDLSKQNKVTLNSLHQIQDEIDVSKDKYIQISEQVKQKQRLLEDILLTVQKWQQKLNTLISRKDTFKEMENDFDGFFHGVKEVLKKRGQTSGGLKGVHGAVAELVNVPANLETAVETALGGALQFIVMENEQDSRQAISYLKQRKLGRATFLPLDVIKSRSIPSHELNKMSQNEGFIGIAADLIHFDSTYQSIVSNLLGQVIIAKSLEQANRIAAYCSYRFKVVTLDGDVVNAGGSMTGGSVQKKNANLLGRKRQIEELEQQIINSQVQLDQLQEKSKNIKKEISDTSSELEELRTIGEQLRLQEQKIQAEIQQCKQQMEHTQSQMISNQKEIDQILVKTQNLIEREKIESEKLSTAKLTEKETQQVMKEVEENRKEQQTIKDEVQNELTELRVKVASITQERQAALEQLDRFRQELELLQQEMDSNQQIQQKLEVEIEQNEQEHVEQVEKLNLLKINKQECTNQIAFKRKERADGLQTIELKESETKEQRIALKKTEDKFHQVEVKANRLDVELDNLLNKLSEDYELSFELAKERYPVPTDIVETQEMVKQLKRKITSLGDVNLGAIDEYERIHNRFEFLSQQQQDLIEAKDTLYQVIEQLGDEMSQRFITTFEEIRKNFVVVFARLFGGGRADLVLSDPENILETGVDIVAQPPGKKLQNLQLLSGGERALTAIALLFAILHVKPVPFCVLDEVEAALDEANVTRFAEYLREFSLQTQFIVVTHRKGTMEEADVLYGITMEEDGVSKLVSVRLDEDEDGFFSAS
ncbi:chromosome segregation protein SMC [Chengkuizengella axinellae]|uniref:Chromosome partition protein Smc n=1 Tax=Chengkuizengella axinellae TaxID=3064388 RepID=A0ABT9IVL5_9BACL|nr:chromosome segregation protein SMC [Chengkuizengella sp. 2205SS18-9]MDP5273409.1 chromosome segregation protein SMC [Chengkuizengella sp. 2205SS18-9]